MIYQVSPDVVEGICSWLSALASRTLSTGRMEVMRDTVSAYSRGVPSTGHVTPAVGEITVSEIGATLAVETAPGRMDNSVREVVNSVRSVVSACGPFSVRRLTSGISPGVVARRHISIGIMPVGDITLISVAGDTISLGGAVLIRAIGGAASTG